MALSKLQFVVIFVLCSQLVTCQSKDVRENADHPSQCVYRGSCESNRDCESQCGPSEFPPETIASCQASPRGHGNICCCAKD
ncbi:hypothetical protein Bca4012_098400 [Brassica carinata]|uniref:BnaC06g07100D protein n=3 Tax=Brassica TaxID=3705 RepID=A0A078H6E5_BRANA|nr:hypothetical protein Bca52824_081076 [Brassica carinata]KAH0872835.1 hypothetical protein HID58_070197 [Brassica napus]CAF2056050.1 unnamed protein product [Brassica napus]CDY33069.1 BnaC06g07100D [Brassica napus]